MFCNITDRFRQILKNPVCFDTLLQFLRKEWISAVVYAVTCSDSLRDGKVDMTLDEKKDENHVKKEAQ